MKGAEAEWRSLVETSGAKQTRKKDGYEGRGERRCWADRGGNRGSTDGRIRSTQMGKGRRLVPRWWQGWNVVCSLSRTIGSLPQGAVVTSPTDPTIALPISVRSSSLRFDLPNFYFRPVISSKPRETIVPRRFQSLKAEAASTQACVETNFFEQVFFFYRVRERNSV